MNFSNNLYQAFLFQIKSILKPDVVKDTLIYILGAFFLKGISFLLIPFYTSIFSPNEFGQIELINNLASIVSIILTFGLTNVVFTEYFHYANETRNQLLIEVFSIYIFLSTPLFIIIAVILSFSSLTQEINSSKATLWLSFSVAHIVFFQTIYFTILQLSKQALRLTLYRVVLGLLLVATNVILLYYLHIGIIGVFIANFFVTLVSIVYPLWLYFHVGCLRIRVNLQKQKEFLKVGIIFTGSTLSFYLMTSVDRWLILNYLGDHEVGIYSVAAKITSIFDPLIITPLLSVYTPRLFNKFSKGFFEQNLFAISMLVCFFSLVFGYVMQVGSHVFVDSKYHSGLYIISIQAMGYAFFFLAQISGAILVFTKKVTSLMINVSMGLLINILLNIFLIIKFNLVGASIAFMLSNFFWFLLTAFQADRLKKQLRNETNVSLI